MRDCLGKPSNWICYASLWYTSPFAPSRPASKERRSVHDNELLVRYDNELLVRYGQTRRMARQLVGGKDKTHWSQRSGELSVELFDRRVRPLTYLREAKDRMIQL
jgi:hypothetical protein